MTKKVKVSIMMMAMLFVTGFLALAQSKTPINVKDLQKGITDYIAKDYAGYTIKNAFKVDKNKVITYDVNVIKGAETIMLQFDNTGKFLKAEQVKSTAKSGTTKSTSSTKTNKTPQTK
ncbi:MAG: hypothetical protein U0W24_17660 [Bacteroidales bacterium]